MQPWIYVSVTVTFNVPLEERDGMGEDGRKEEHGVQSLILESDH